MNNGGFQQYFWNSTGELAAEALAGLTLLGAEPHARLMERAIAIAADEAKTRETFKRRNTIEAFSESYKHTRLTALDETFYELPPLDKYRMRLIRQHPELFAK